jgi:hypothetical protein
MRKYRLFKAAKILVMIVVAVIAFGYVTMALWNALMPAIFGLKVITFWQSLGLLLLGKILFGGIHRHGGGRPGWKRGMQQRFANMTPEEREKFRAGMRGRSWCRPCEDVQATEPTSL